jgi:hypothetical protein
VSRIEYPESFPFDFSGILGTASSLPFSLGSHSFLWEAVLHGPLKKPTEGSCLLAKQQASLWYLERTGGFLGVSLLAPP